ncbi:MAG: glycosyltransferase [Elusimicrobia bacterium]|nr:glycosyltransferase [Elusimicrobiota bacterium]
MEDNIDLTVVIPAYNEAENLRVLLPRLAGALKRAEIISEILVVDRVVKTDATPEICRTNGAVYINRKNSDFFGAAIRTGIARSKGRFVAFMDADGSHPPEFVTELYRFRNDYDVVVASRYVDGGGAENTKTLIFMSRVLNRIYSLVLNIHCKDISNNFKLYRRELLVNLRLYCDNFDIVEEILFKIVKNNPGARIKEIPFNFEKRKFGETKRDLFAFMISFAVTLLKLRFGLK